ncbi:HDOD domain-containing protein [Ideonella livida]|uniref:HDOD domain-containing protein n=1 Tax=Ideonella livida TaxID=2707176 RepID=A0A7C9PE77_9BURK|nr:HDOD domain-containing protein [Ideonella livida]NDY89593.1 HDOD domain-containing protein [Ideonella livida]
MPGRAVRRFSRFQLLRLLGKSERTMVWLVIDDRSGQEGLLALPREPLPEDELALWLQTVRRAARLSHPALLPVVEAAAFQQRPYVLYDRGPWVTWSEVFSRQGLDPQDLARWAAHAAQALAFAHEAGVAHHDVQPWMLLCRDGGHGALLGLEVAGRWRPGHRQGAMEELQAVRRAALTDVLGLGLVMHQALAAQPALEEPDTGRVIARMPPAGNDIVRLPWTVPRAVPDPLRAIVNRATDRQERQRYRNARTLQRALEGWLKTVAGQEGGPLALVLDRLRSVGVLPAMPGGADQVARLALMERCRTGELASLVLGDMALSFELLRQVNGLAARQARAGEHDPVLMLRRAIAMVGLDGVRQAALSLRPWPGPLSAEAAREMMLLIRRVQRAARVAVALAPAGYDPEVVTLVAMMQNLGRLVVQYHFPEEAAQIRRLTQPDEGAGAAGEPGMGAEAAAYAVLGVDVEALGLAVAQHWGLPESLLHMMTRFGPRAVVRTPESDLDSLRVAGCCANELIDALSLPPRRVQPAVRAVVQRYARALGVTGTDMQDAVKSAVEAERSASAGRPAGGEPRGMASEAGSAQQTAPPAPGGAAGGSAGDAGASPPLPQGPSSLRLARTASGRWGATP